MSEDPVLLMSPAKVLNRLGRERQSDVLPSGSVLVTSGDVDVEPHRFADVAVFEDYTHDDEIPLIASEAIVRHGLGRIVVLAEADILRSAELRKRHGLPGQSLDEAMLFRDKPSMKARVSQAGIAVAPHRTVSSGLELADAVEQLGYPCVVKPPHGRGSSGVEVLTGPSSLSELLRRGPFSDRGHKVELLVESFQQGEQYRVDGVYQGGELRLVSVAVYVGSHLDYLSGGHLGSIIVPESDTDSRAILELARGVMEDALPTFDGGFHLEAFLGPEGPVFSEVGARLGGGSIPEEIELSYGANITEMSIRAQRGVLPAGEVRFGQLGLAGQLHVSPKVGLLASAPARWAHPAVRLSEIASAGKYYGAMSHTNAEFARAVFTADTVPEARTTIEALLSELHESTRWSLEPEGAPV